MNFEHWTLAFEAQMTIDTLTSSKFQVLDLNFQKIDMQD
jgi:hypothetical protein